MTTFYPCPFCGSDDTFVGECEHVQAGCSTFWVECNGCGARGSVSEYKEGAVQYWNKLDGRRSHVVSSAEQGAAAK